MAGINHTMRAAVYERYGGPEVVHIATVPRPQPGANEVLIRIRATTIASGDWRMRSALVPGSLNYLAPFIFGRRPKKPVLGTELAGTVEQIGSRVTKWQVGDAVFAFPGGSMGAHAEYICLPEDGRLARKPAALDFAPAAALCFGGSTALSYIEKSRGIHRGDHVLVIGASGAVGSAMVQIAKHFGAVVTGVSSGKNVELVRSIGADDVIDYTTADPLAGDRRYNLIVDTIGTITVAKGKSRLQPGGQLLLVMAGLGTMLRSVVDRTIIAGPAGEDPKHLPILADLADKGHFKPLIDGIYPFEDIVEAHRRVDTGRKRGNVVVTFNW